MNGILLALALLGSPDTFPAAAPPPAPAAPDTLPVMGREAVEALEFPPLVFEPPEATEHRVLGVPVFHLHDPSLPLVDLMVRVRGGLSHLPREDMAAVTALPTLLRSGGTRELPPDSVDRRVDLLALQLSFSGGGGGTAASMNALTHRLDQGLPLLRDLLLRPGFHRETVEIWRDREVEGVRRREDDPTGLGYSEFNRLMFGDHPVGWVMGEEDLAPDRLAEERLRRVHAALYCRENLILGVSGDLTWDETEPRIAAFVEEWPPCREELPEPPLPEMREEGAVFVLPRELEQTTILMAHPGGVRQGNSEEFFAAQVANRILGAGGLSSRLMERLRTELGLTYGASSLWTTPRRHEGLVGAVTATRADRTVQATRTLLEILEGFRDDPPTDEEVELALDEIAHGYVFAFQSPSQIVARQMSHRAQELPDDWLELYLEGIQGVTPESAARVIRSHLHPERMTILLVGDPDRFDPGLEELGAVYRLHPDGTYEPWGSR